MRFEADDGVDLTNLRWFLDHLRLRDAEAAEIAVQLLYREDGWRVKTFWGPERDDDWCLVMERSGCTVRLGVAAGTAEGAIGETQDGHQTRLTSLASARGWLATLPMPRSRRPLKAPSFDRVAPDGHDLTNLRWFFDHLELRNAEASRLAKQLVDREGSWTVKRFWGPEQMDVWSLVMERAGWTIEFGIERGIANRIIATSDDGVRTSFESTATAKEWVDGLPDAPG